MKHDIQMPWHLPPYSDLAGTVLDWHPTDTEARFHEMMQDPVHRKYFVEQGWDKLGGITYSFNSHGFRSEEFVLSADNLVALGCSFTMGIGLPYKDVWPTRLGRALNLRVCNLAWGGGSSDRCFRMAEYWVPHIRPKLVVLLNPPRGRLEVIVDDATGETETISDKDFDENIFLKKWISTDANLRLNNRKNSLAIQALCNELSIPFLSYEADEWMSRSREEAGYARDYFHAGPEGHRTFTERILNDFAAK